MCKNKYCISIYLTFAIAKQVSWNSYTNYKINKIHIKHIICVVVDSSIVLSRRISRSRYFKVDKSQLISET